MLIGGRLRASGDRRVPESRNPVRGISTVDRPTDPGLVELDLRPRLLLVVGALLLCSCPRRDVLTSSSPEVAPAPEAWIGDLSPIPSAAWSSERVAHLLERVAFGGDAANARRLTSLGPEAAVDWLLDLDSRRESLPAFADGRLFEIVRPPLHPNPTDAFTRALEGEEVYGVKRASDGLPPLQEVLERIYLRRYGNQAETLRLERWWAERMLVATCPVEERMVLFWHDHFATRASKVADYRKMLLQIGLFRRHALGNFRELLRAVLRDPALSVFLDHCGSVKGRAVENLAREVMELFVLGVGHYTEADVREMARALTGWTLDPETELFCRFDPERHDDGEKRILGEEGRFGTDDVVDILLRQPQAARHLVTCLYESFVREDPSPRVIDGLASLLERSNWEIRPVLRTLLLSRDFYSTATIGAQIKGPVHFVVSTCRKLGLTTLPADFHAVCSRLGQVLGYPPSVAGWDEGRSWINTVTLEEREVFVRRLLGFSPSSPARGRRHSPGMSDHESVDAEGLASVSLEKIGRDVSREGVRGGPFDHRVARRKAAVRVSEWLAPSETRSPRFELTGLLAGTGTVSADEVVSAFLERFVTLRVSEATRETLVALVKDRLGEHRRAGDPRTEEVLRELALFILTLAEYQVS